MRIGLIRRVGSLAVAGALMTLVASPAAGAAVVNPTSAARAGNADPVSDGPTVVTSGGVTTVNEGVQGTYSWSVVDPAPDYPYAIHVDWGDGTATILTNQTGTDFALNHTYSASAPTGSQGGTVYTATLSVMDAIGATASASQQVDVIDVAPVLTAPAAITVLEGSVATITLANFTDASVGPWQVLVVSSTGGRLLQTLPSPSAIQVPWDASWGSATVTVQVGDRGGLYGMATVRVSTANSPPVVGPISFTGSTSDGHPEAGLPMAAQVNFTDPGLANTPYPEGYSCTVDYGDGSGPQLGTAGPQPGQTAKGICFGPIHTYSGFGNFTVTANVFDVNGGSGSSSVVVQVRNVAPQVGPIVVPGPLVEGKGFVASASFADPDNGPNPDRCMVDFGTDAGATRGFVSGSICTAPPYEYPDAGSFTITFTLTDSYGASGSSQATVVVGNVPPEVDSLVTSGADSTGGVVTAQADFYDPSVGETYVCSVDFGDGTGPQPGVIGDAQCTADHLYSQGGLYTVTLTVTDSNGGSGSASTTVSIADVSALTVSAVMSNYDPDEWQSDPSVSSAVTASATFTDPGSDGETYTCAVDYGDGTLVAGVVEGMTCTGSAHQYRVTGSYAVTVTVTDSDGVNGIGTTGVYYRNRAPWVGGLGLVGDLRFGAAPHAVTAVVDPGDGFETYTCTIDYGDGSAILPGTWVPTGWSDDLPRCVFPDHVYPATGSYTLTAVVTDSGGASGSTQAMETIGPAIPVIQSVSAPSSVPEGSAASASAVFMPTALNETYTCTVDYGDGTGPVTGVVTGSTCQGPSHIFGLPSSLMITIVVTSAGGQSSTAWAVSAVTDVDPTVAPNSVPSTGVAGTAYAASVTFSDPGASLGEPETCIIDYGDSGGGGWFGTISGSTCQGPQHFYSSKGTYQLVATVTDSYGGVGTYSQTITVYNPRPIVGIVVAPDSVSGGTSFKASADFTTTGRTETYSCTVDYGDRTGSQAGVVTGTTCQGPSHTYKILGTFTINVAVKGSATGTGSSSKLIGVTPPIIAVGAISLSGSTIEGSSVTAKAGFTPTGVTETYRCTVDYGDNLGTPAGTISGNTCTGPKHALGRGGSSIVTISVYGSAGTYGTSSKTISVTNVGPTFTKVTIPPTVKLGTALTVTGTFTDPGTSETYQLTYTWDDGTTTTVQLTAGMRSFSASHTFAKPGAYSVNVALGDGDWVYYNSGVAVYDPARSATGSGTFASPSGACHLSSKCGGASTGTFAFNAGYAKGATKPTASFTFSVAGLSYSASAVDVFIGVDGTITMWGTGTLNCVGGYRFTLEAVDGKPDSIFISVIDSKANVIYENDGASSLKTGSIVLK